MLLVHIVAQNIIMNFFTKEPSFQQKIMSNIKPNVNLDQTVMNVSNKE